jgi:hypothetical protein
MLIIQPGKTMKILEGTRMTIGTSHTDEVDILVKGQIGRAHV